MLRLNELPYPWPTEKIGMELRIMNYELPQDLYLREQGKEPFYVPRGTVVRLTAGHNRRFLVLPEACEDKRVWSL